MGTNLLELAGVLAFLDTFLAEPVLERLRVLLWARARFLGGMSRNHTLQPYTRALQTRDLVLVRKK